MKIQLIAINAKYIHTNLAIYSLRAYASDYRDQIILTEFTINQYTDDILQAIYIEKPDILAFSCYLWNISMVEELCKELRKLLPDTKIWLGGPEVSYDAVKRLRDTADIDGIMIGEGEETFKELLDYYVRGSIELDKVKGIAYHQSARKRQGFYGAEDSDYDFKDSDIIDNDVNESDIGQSAYNDITVTVPRTELNFSSLPFPYEDVNLEDFNNKIIYYESIRGCPYSCSYCLSSIDKKVRIRDINQVKKELDVFLEHKVRQVKFVDRTFNCSRSHALSIWNYIKEHDNGITNFHFEISADILEEEELNLLNTLRAGLVQLEIGVQSTHNETIDAIHRRMNLNRLAYAVERIHQGNNIHQHLDLIAGLPYEDYTTFKNSFNEVYAMKPDQLQLGFLKVLKGSDMQEVSRRYGIVYKSVPPYEVLFTKWLSYDELLLLKIVEDMVEVYYNSGQFKYAITYMEHFFKTPFELYQEIGNYYIKNHLQGIKHSRIRRYEILSECMKELFSENGGSGFNREAFSFLLVHDLYLRENLKSRPYFAEDQEPYKKFYQRFIRDEQMVKEYTGNDLSNLKMTELKQFCHLEHYTIDIGMTAKTGEAVSAEQYILYDYMHRNPLNSEARAIKLDAEQKKLGCF